MGFTTSNSTGSREVETVRWWPMLHIWSDKGLSQVTPMGELYAFVSVAIWLMAVFKL